MDSGKEKEKKKRKEMHWPVETAEVWNKLLVTAIL